MRIGVCGAGGRIGREVCRAVSAEQDLDLVCVIDPAFAGSGLEELVPDIPERLSVGGEVRELAATEVDAMVDFSIAAAARDNVPYALGEGIHCVVGTTGFIAEDLERFDDVAREKGVGCLLAPNFAIGAVLMMDFAARAARYMQDCEIIELHHPEKLDAPSGTAKNTARSILEAKGEPYETGCEEGPRGLDIGGIRIHSVRLTGLVAHQEVIFGGQGQTLSIRHDSTDRTSFMPGVILALRKVTGLRGLVVGLDRLLEL